jgi:hypothetical protein
MEQISTTAKRVLCSSFLIVVGWMSRRMADMMVVEGYQKAGYAYVMLDDCWSVVFFPYCCWMDVQEDGGHDGGGGLPEGWLRLRHAGRLLVQSQQDEGGKVSSQRRKNKNKNQNNGI